MLLEVGHDFAQFVQLGLRQLQITGQADQARHFTCFVAERPLGGQAPADLPAGVQVQFQLLGQGFTAQHAEILFRVPLAELGWKQVAGGASPQVVEAGQAQAERAAVGGQGLRQVVLQGGHGGGKEGEADPALGKISEGPDGVTFYTLPNMVANIQSPDGRPTYLKLTLTLEMKDAEVAAHLQEETPRMQDMFQSVLRERRPEDLAGSAGSYQIRAEILRRVNLLAAPGKVDAVLIEEMLVQ